LFISQYLFLIKTIIDIIIFCIICFLLLFLTYLNNPDFWENYFYFFKYTLFESTSNRIANNTDTLETTSLILTYLFQIFVFLLFEVSKALIIFILFYFVPVYFLKKTGGDHDNIKTLLKILIVFFITYLSIQAIPPFEPQNIYYLKGSMSIRFIFAALLLGSLFYLIKIKNNDNANFRKLIFLIIIALAVYLHPTGTNTNFIGTTSFALVIIGGVFSTLLYIETNGFKKEKPFIFFILAGCAVVISYSTFLNQYMQYKRNASYDKQTHYSKYSSYLSGIKIEENLALNIDNLWLTLQSEGFNFTSDRIFAYDDIPGYLSAIGVKSYGQPWNISGYPNSLERSCHHLAHQTNTGIRYVYILKTVTGQENNQIEKCLLERITPLKNSKQYTIGKAYHYRNKIEYELVLDGPYQLRKNI